MSDLVVCPHCGRLIDLTDPRLMRLTSAQFAVWHSIEGQLAQGPLGVTDIAALAGMQPGSAMYHIRKLRNAGLLDAIPKRTGGSYKVYVAAA